MAFPPIEMDFSGLPDGMPHILDSKAKWDEKSAEYKGTQAVLADLPDELRAKLAEGGGRRLPRPARARLRPHRPAADRDGRDLRHRGERQLLPGAVRASSPPRRRPPASITPG